MSYLCEKYAQLEGIGKYDPSIDPSLAWGLGLCHIKILPRAWFDWEAKVATDTVKSERTNGHIPLFSVWFKRRIPFHIEAERNGHQMSDGIGGSCTMETHCSATEDQLISFKGKRLQ